MLRPNAGQGLLSFTRFLDHTQRRTTVSRTPLNKRSARRRDLYLTTHNTHNRQTFMPTAGFEPHNFSRRAAADLHLRQRRHWDLSIFCQFKISGSTYCTVHKRRTSLSCYKYVRRVVIWNPRKCRLQNNTVEGHCSLNTGLFISPSGTSELDCATTKKDRAERSISIGRESIKLFICTRGLGVLAGSTARG